MKHYPALQFAVFRILFGLYLCAFFFLTAPHAPTLFSDRGLLPNPEIAELTHYFPNVLLLNDSAALTQGLCWLLAGLGLVFALGIYRRVAALVMWYGFACLVHRNQMFWSPAMPYLGWLLLASILVPLGEPLSVSFKKKRVSKSWHMPSELYWGAWLVMASSYSISGVFKLASPSWADGSAIALALDWLWARDCLLTDLFLSLPALALQTMTWLTLVLELCFLPAIFFRRGRIVFWFLMTVIHLHLLLLLDLMDLTSGVLLMHLFTFDVTWLKPARRGLLRTKTD